jgi:predicted RND superfamily exporter protein
MQGFPALRRGVAARLTAFRRLPILLPAPMNGAFGPLARRALSISTRHPWAVLAATAALTVFFAFFATRIQIDTDLANLLPKDAEVNRTIERYAGEAAGSRLLVVAIEGEGLFDLGTLAGFSAALDAIAALPGVTGEITPFNLPTFQRSGDGRLQIAPLSTGRTAPADEAGLAGFRARLAATRYARNLVASADGQMLAAFVQVAAAADAADLMSGVRTAIERAARPGVATRVTGMPALDERTEHYLSRDAIRLLALAAAVVLLFYWFGFRSKRGVLLSFAVVLLGTLWSVGLMGLAGIRLSLVSIVAPPLILIFGNEYAIYVMNAYYRASGSLEARDAGPAWIDRAVARVAWPIAMAFVTTIVGFLALCVTDIRQTQEFAVVASFGSLACGGLALFSLPAFLSLIPRPREHRTRRLLEGPLSRLMRRTARGVAAHPLALLAAVPAVVAVFLLGLRLLAFNTDSVTYYPQRDPVIRDMYAMTAKLGGFNEIHLTYEAPEGTQGYFLDPAVLRQVAAVEEAVRADPDVSWSISLPSFLSDVNYAVDGTTDLPENRGVVMLFSRLIARAMGGAGAGGLLGNLADDGFNRLTITFRIGNSESGRFMDEQRFRGFLAGLRAVVAANPVGDARPAIWGDIMRSLSLADSLRRFLLISVGISLATIFAVAALSFRSVVEGLYAIVPLGCGLMLNFAFMAFAGIPLDMTTMMVANITIGVGIDSAIYLGIEFRRQLRGRPADLRGAVDATLQVMGRPVILSTVSIVAGLAALATAAFRPIVYFGLLVLFSLAVTAAGNLVLLPALLVLDRRFRARRRREGSTAG